MPERVNIAPLTGINLNAVEGEAQQTPVKVQGFNLDRGGGYSLEHAVSGTEIITMSGDVRVYSPDGEALLDDRRSFLFNRVEDLKNSSVDGTELYLVPKVGIVSNPFLIDEDRYKLGGYLKDNRGNVGELPGFDFTISASSASFSGNDFVQSGSYRFMGVAFAPTEMGLVAYEAITKDFSTSSVAEVTVTTQAPLPEGYTMRMYFTQVDSVQDNTFYIVEYEKASDGNNTIEFVLRDTYEEITSSTFDLAGSKQNPTDDAFLGFANNLVELHKQRVYGVAGQQVFTGPFAAKTTAQKYIWGEFDRPGSYLVTSSDAALNLSSQVYVFLEFASGIEWRTFARQQKESSDWWVPFVRQEDVFEVGLKIVRANGLQEAYPYISVNGDTFVFPEPIPAEDGNKQFELRSNFFAGEFVSIIVDLQSSGSDAVRFIVSDQTVTQLYRFDYPVKDSWSTSFNAFSGQLETFGFISGSNSTLGVLNVGIYETEFFDDTSATSLVAFLDSDDYSFSSNEWTAASTSETWALNTLNGSVVAGAYQAERLSALQGTQVTVTTSTTSASVTSTVTINPGGINLYPQGGGTQTSPTTSTTTTSVTTTTSFVEVNANRLNVLPNLPKRKVLAYTDIRKINFGNFDNYVYVDLQNSNRITALRSSPAGLIIFGNNETFLLRSDPDLPDFDIQRVFGTLGNDDGVTPAVLGGVVFPIWKGRVYSVSLGMGDVDFGSGVNDISDPVFNPDDPFISVVGYPGAREIVAKTQNGVVLRYSPSKQAWYTDVYSEAEGLKAILPSGDFYGVRYQIDDKLYVTGTNPDTGTIEFANIDLGDKVMRKQWRRAYLYTNDSYSGTPTLTYDAGVSSGSLTGSREGDGEFVFTFPNGLTSTKLKTLRLTLSGAKPFDSVEAPVELEFTPRYRRR